MNLAEVIDNVDIDLLEEVVTAWLKDKRTTLWSTFDLGETNELEDAAQWLVSVLLSIDGYAAEWEGDENNETTDRIRPSSSDGEDSEPDIYGTQLSWC